eukprot:gene29063-32267_t
MSTSDDVMPLGGTSAVGGPAPTAARQGRHKQRYGEGGERLVAGCIPVRMTGQENSVDNVEVLMVSSRGGKGFCFPKGGWEDDETVEAAAMRETVEEAGVRGELEEPIVGTFPFGSKHMGTKHADDTPHGGRCRAHMYVMHVLEVLEVWPESSERQRHWCQCQLWCQQYVNTSKHTGPGCRGQLAPPAPLGAASTNIITGGSYHH